MKKISSNRHNIKIKLQKKENNNNNNEYFNEKEEKEITLTKDEKLIYGNRNMRNYIKIKLLGKGGCGIVWLCYKNINKDNVDIEEAAPTPVERFGNDFAEIACYETPLVKVKKGGSVVVVPRKKYRFVHFFDQCSLEDDSDALKKYVISHTNEAQNAYPVLLVTYADIIEPATQLTTLLRQIPQCTVLGIPAIYMCAVTKKLMSNHESFFKARHKSGVSYDIRDRYQYLMSIIRQTLKNFPHVPICILNAPIAFPPAFISSSSSSSSTSSVSSVPS